ncbi:MAG TPA: sensor domain-containing diguanylate cyclase [Pseudoalteromonas prydzensis]|uniref:Sensor domain-containing diguanylate cyclase n=1 Tax=Pseudoalteromonas prydzensis TaxID=182141 RepID=A0A7V1GFP4_9GAMM|nr:sensor domain-containing diguanylate cyclase [Pseudoalteromonas prydzensis]HEA17903.1 sensor domain-containing diguanylate cyclase [Pseudoalteromonas prydzensis]
MDKPLFPDNEEARLAALRALNILDTQSEESLDRVTRLAKYLFAVPISLISLIDEDRQWFKSCIGLDVKETPRDISFCGHAILDDNPLVICDALTDPRFADNPLVLNTPKIRFYAGYPIKLEGMCIGTLCIIDSKSREFASEDIQALKDLALIAQRELSIMQLATRDELTNIPNRRGFSLMAERYLDLCMRQQLNAIVIFIDLDSFKPINDEYGHAEGDRVLHLFASVISASCRKSDLFGRFGGDEFVLMLTQTTLRECQLLISRIEERASKLSESLPNLVTFSFSFGIAEFDPQHPLELEALLQIADADMYKNKAAKKAS